MDFRVLHDLGYFEPRDRFYNEGTSVPEPAALASFFSGVITGAVRPRHKGLYGFPDRQWRAAAKLLPFLKVMDTPTTPFTTPDRQVQNAFQSAPFRDRELLQSYRSARATASSQSALHSATCTRPSPCRWRTGCRSTASSPRSGCWRSATCSSASAAMRQPKAARPDDPLLSGELQRAPRTVHVPQKVAIMDGCWFQCLCSV